MSSPKRGAAILPCSCLARRRRGGIIHYWNPSPVSLFIWNLDMHPSEDTRMGSIVLLDLMGGVALLLWGLHMVLTGVLRAFGPHLRRFLGKPSATASARLAPALA